MSLPTIGASTRFLCVSLYVLLQSLCKKSQTCHKYLVKSHKTWQKSIQGSSECFHVSFILMVVVLKGFCETCSNVLESHKKITGTYSCTGGIDLDHIPEHANYSPARIKKKFHEIIGQFKWEKKLKMNKV